MGYNSPPQAHPQIQVQIPIASASSPDAQAQAQSIGNQIPTPYRFAHYTHDVAIPPPTTPYAITSPGSVYASSSASPQYASPSDVGVSLGTESEREFEFPSPIPSLELSSPLPSHQQQQQRQYVPQLSSYSTLQGWAGAGSAASEEKNSGAHGSASALRSTEVSPASSTPSHQPVYSSMQEQRHHNYQGYSLPSPGSFANASVSGPDASSSYLHTRYMAYETYAHGERFRVGAGSGAYTHSAEGYLLPGPPGAVYTGVGGSPTSPVSSVTTVSSSSASPPADRDRDYRGHLLGGRGANEGGGGGGGAIVNADANAGQHGSDGEVGRAYLAPVSPAHRQYHHHQHDRQIVRQQYYGEFETEYHREYQQEYSQAVLIHPQTLPYAHAHAHEHAYGAEKHQHQQQEEGPDTAGGGANTEFPPMHAHMHDASPLMFASPGESAILEYSADIDMEMERSVGVMDEYVPGGVTHDAYVFESYPAAGMGVSPEP